MLVISSYNGLNRTLFRVLSRKLTLVKNTSRRVVITQISDRLLLLVTIAAPLEQNSLSLANASTDWGNCSTFNFQVFIRFRHLVSHLTAARGPSKKIGITLPSSKLTRMTGAIANQKDQ